MKRLCAILVMASVLLVTGCAQGTNGLWSVANPQSSITFSPFSKSLKVFSSDGKTFSFDELEMRWSENGKLMVKNFKMDDRSVENRTANVDQLKMQAVINEANWKGMGDLVEKSIGAAISGAVKVFTQGVKVSAQNTPLGDASLEVGGNNTKVEAVPTNE